MCMLNHPKEIFTKLCIYYVGSSESMVIVVWYKNGIQCTVGGDLLLGRSGDGIYKGVMLRIENSPKSKTQIVMLCIIFIAA